jgi:S1-C subfamily serine protease
MRILGWGFILLGIFDFLSSLIGLNLTPFFPQGLSKFTPLIFGFIGSVLLKIKLEQKIDFNKKREIFNKFKMKIEWLKYLRIQKNFLNKKNIYLISFVFIFIVAFAGYYIYQDKSNERLNTKKINEERIEKNKKDIIEILTNSKRLEEVKNKARDEVTSNFANAIKESREARNYCDQIHSQPSLRIFLEREECAWSEKVRIFRKYEIDYDRTIAIINREYEELENIARNASQNIILGNRFNREEHAKRITLVRQRTTEQLLYEKDRFIEKLISKLEKSPTFSSTSKTKKGGSGSAFFINKKGYIITNNHVIESCPRDIIVSHNRKAGSANLVVKDANLDLAVLSTNLIPVQFIKLSKNSGEKLDRIVVAGYPLGEKISDELKLTSGIVSATKGWKDNINEFQIDAALNPGNSGGPVVNDAGNLVGVSVAGLANRQNLNFAIKSKAVKDFLDVNKVSYSKAIMEFDMDNKKRLKLLEDSTVFIYCN